MLSIGAMGNGQGTYYVGLAREDYYLEGGEPPGQWVGQGCEALGLKGEVSRDEFLNLFAGCDGQGVPLVQNARASGRQPGWDLTFSAPKSVSVLWATTDRETRRALQEAHFRAVKSALVSIESVATTRRGHGGEIKQTAKLVIATFEHGTSRAQDPQLHTHALVLNLAVRTDGTTGALESQRFYRSKMAVGALYRAELSKQLQELGFGIERDGSSFRIAGSPVALEEEFSKRRAEIESRLGENGRDSARAAAFAALDTRRVKEHIARDELFTVWREVGHQFGFGLSHALRLKGKSFAPDARNREKALESMLAAGIENLSLSQSHFGEGEIVRAVAEDSQGRGIGADEVRSAVANNLKDNPRLVALGLHRGEARYTTRELWNIEKSLLEGARRLGGTVRHRAGQKAFLKGLSQAQMKATEHARALDPKAQVRELNSEQRSALSHLTKESGGVALLSGMAGTGKTFLLDAAREVWQEQGFKVIGTSVAGKAARGLEEGAGIKSSTLARLALEWERGFEEPGASESYARKEGRELLKKHSERRARFELDANTVLVVDEAGMVGTRQMALLVEKAERSGAKLVLVGDARQLQAVEVGGPFRALEERIGNARLTGIVRQREAWARQAVHDFAAGRAQQALQAFHERGMVKVSNDRQETKAALIRSWQTAGIEKPNENMIFAGTRAEVQQLNRMAQEARRIEGKLGFRSASVGGTRIYEKDRVVFMKNSPSLGVQNGSQGHVQSIDYLDKTMKVKLDGGLVVSVPYEHYEGLALGYALTTHKGQGLTTRNSFVLCGGNMTDRELAYVQASRARESTQFFTERLTVWNPETQRHEDATLQELARQMSQSRQKDLAHDVGHVPERETVRQENAYSDEITLEHGHPEMGL